MYIFFSCTWIFQIEVKRNTVPVTEVKYLIGSPSKAFKFSFQQETCILGCCFPLHMVLSPLYTNVHIHVLFPVLFLTGHGTRSMILQWYSKVRNNPSEIVLAYVTSLMRFTVGPLRCSRKNKNTAFRIFPVLPYLKHWRSPKRDSLCQQ